MFNLTSTFVLVFELLRVLPDSNTHTNFKSGAFELTIFACTSQHPTNFPSKAFLMFKRHGEQYSISTANRSSRCLIARPKRGGERLVYK